MGGVNSTVETKDSYYNNSEGVTSLIRRTDFQKIPSLETKINQNNYIQQLSKYNLSRQELLKIKVGFNCSFTNNNSFKKYIFTNKGEGIFKMECRNLRISTNNYGEKNLKINKNSIQCKVDNPDVITEITKKGWGILSPYKSTVQTKTKRPLKPQEIQVIKKYMKQNLERKMLLDRAYY